MFKILFIGIGNMGFPMAGYLSKLNKVTVYNRSKEKIDKWLSIFEGKSIKSLSEINKEYDFVISCIGNDDDLRDITISQNGCLDQLKENSIFIDHSTVSPKLVLKLEKSFAERKVNFLDAPISGGQSGAENGTLSIMVGGNKQSFIRSEEVLKSYGKKIKFMGSPGSGQLTKIINQVCIAGLIQGLSEAIYFMKQTNLSPDDVLEVISSGAAQSWQMENRFKTMVDNEFDFGFAVDLMRKDLSITFDQAKEYGIDLQITKIVDDFYSEIQKMGGNKYDTSSLVKRLTS
tara:strand:- start:25 stop:888 length:864 start_codon:yes stop_codon:yes gene_type:complete